MFLDLVCMMVLILWSILTHALAIVACCSLSDVLFLCDVSTLHLPGCVMTLGQNGGGWSTETLDMLMDVNFPLH